MSRCLFGSDGPYFHHQGDRFDYRPSLAILNGLGLSDADLERVAHLNFQELIAR